MIPTRLRPPIAAAGCMVLLAGCATHHLSAPAYVSLPAAVELEAVPFFPQEAHQCGPAALATTLTWSGLEVTPQELTEKVYLPGRRGSLQIELVAVTRDYGRVPYVFRSDLSALLGEVATQRPVLVLLNLGTSLLPVWHYAVVVGYSKTTEEIILRSGTRERALLSTSKFLRAWERADLWSMVILHPGELPATGDEETYLTAVAALESLDRCDLAGRSYLAAVGRWPDSAIAWFGLGNCHYQGGDWKGAEEYYRRALQIQPQHAPALNNLAQLLSELDRCREARETIDKALAVAEINSALLATLTETSEDIRNCRQ